MRRIAFVLSIILGSASGSLAQYGYWQQHASYQMEIDFDVETHRFTGVQKLTYTNNSPDTLNRVFYHLYFNAFQPGSMMDVRSQTIADPDQRVVDRISKLKPDEIGYHKVFHHSCMLKERVGCHPLEGFQCFMSTCFGSNHCRVPQFQSVWLILE